MRAVVQRVTEASVEVDGEVVGRIEGGLLVLLGVAEGDTEADRLWMARKVAGLRIFRDDEGRMNRNIEAIGGAVLLVSQFTLCADTTQGHRPSFVDAAPPEVAQPLVDRVGRLLEERGITLATGMFGASMLVTLENDGPVTIVLDHRRTPDA